MFVRVKQNSNRKERRGAAMVEMAVVLPVFFMVVMGIVEFGRGMMVTQVVTNCAREAARTGILEGSTNSDVESFVNGYMNTSLQLEPGDVTTAIVVKTPTGTEKANNNIAQATRLDLIEVHVSVPYEKVNFVPIRWLKGTSIRGQSVMRREF